MSDLMQIMTQVVASGDRQGLARWCLSHLASRVAANPSVLGLIVNVAQDNPLPELYPGESLQGEDFDVIVQTWVSSREEWQGAFEPLDGELARRCARRFDYRISDFTVKDDKTALPRANPSPGYKLMRGLVFHPDLGPAAARRQWAHHAKLAVQVHVGVARYTQHWVEEVLTPGAPLIGGFSELHFPSVEAMRDRYFDSPRGQQEILHDIGHFIASGSKRFYGREYLIK